MPADSGYYRHPTIHRDTIVFVCEDDLWSVSAEGGVARRLTASPGLCNNPRFSPDGKKIAYTGRDEGPCDVFIMDAEGGPSRRLTWTGSQIMRTVGWSKDGDSVRFISSHEQPFLGAFRLHEIDADGGATRLLPYGLSREVSYQARGPGVVLAVNSADPARWKRYRGGTAGRIWIDTAGKGKFKPLVELDGNLACPMWIGSRIYFLSDHEGHGNIYSCTPAGKGVQRHTHHQDYYARFASSDGRRITYHCGADLWVYNPKSDTTGAVSVELHSPRHGRGRKFINAASFLEDASLHPSGHSLACSVRGGAYTLPLWEGAPRRHGDVSASRYRHTSYLPDGKRIVAVTDEAGEEGLIVFRADGPSSSAKRLRTEIGRVLDLAVAPLGLDRVAIANHRQELLIVALGTGRKTVVASCDADRIQQFSWSPCGRWLAYGFHETPRTCTLHVYDTKENKDHAITRSDFNDFAPSFDPSGRYLYFVSMRDYDPVYDNQYFDLGFPKGSRPYLIPLTADLPSPFESGTRAPRSLQDNGGGSKKNGKPVTRIDFAGIADRVVPFPVPEGCYVSVRGAGDRVFFDSWEPEGSLGNHWSNAGEPDARGLLEFHDFDTGKTERLVRGITDFSLSPDTTALMLRVGNKLRVISSAVESSDLSSRPAPGRDSGWVDLGRIRAEVQPNSEWRQMFREAWRLQRDQFWTEDMSSIDWPAVHDRYIPLVDRISCRSEFSDLMWEMQGELGTSHCYEMGGDYQPSPNWQQGYLGADLEYASRKKGWRIARIPRGDSWSRAACSPLAAPGLGIREGDEILEVDGKQVSADLTPQECLVNRANSEVALTVRDRRGKSRQVIVRTLASEYRLRYRDWVEANRAAVHKQSRGQVGYVHIPNMGPLGYSEFHRYFKVELDRPGLIVDVRWNGGGHVSQLILEKLARKRIGYDYSRWQAPMPYPSEATLGPMVALTNEYAGSDGDIFSHCFKLMGLGPLIGKRTWGGVVGIWPRHSLVDGAVTTQPEFSFWFEDAQWEVENYGTDPDIEVELSPQDHAAGRDPQLERALEEARKLIRKERPAVPKIKNRPKLAAPRLPAAKKKPRRS